MRKKRRGEWCLQRDRLVLCHWHMRSRCIMSRTCRQSKSKLIGNLQKIQNHAFNLWIAAGIVGLRQTNHSNPEPDLGFQILLQRVCKVRYLRIAERHKSYNPCRWVRQDITDHAACENATNYPQVTILKNDGVSNYLQVGTLHHAWIIRKTFEVHTQFLPVRYVTQSSSYVCRFWALQCVGRANSKPVC